MKKLLGIVVLGLLFCNTVNGSILESKCTRKNSGYVHKIILINVEKNFVKESRFYTQSDLEANKNYFPGQPLEQHDYFKIIRFDKNIVEYTRTVREWLQWQYDWSLNEKWNPNNPKSVKKFFKRKDAKDAGLSDLDDTMQWFLYNYSRDGQVIEVTSPFHDMYKKKVGATNDLCEKAEDISVAKKPKKKEPKSIPGDDKIVPAGSGSGFFVSKDGHAITNYHVIQGCDFSKLSFKGSQEEVKILAVDKVNDLAILKSNVKPDVIFPVSNEDVSLLEDVIVAGFPLGKQISSAIKTHKGVVTALAGAGDNYSFFQTDAAINQGNSGGPIINQKGNIVGIAVATWVEEGVQGVHFGIKSSTLKTFASANGLSFASPNFKDLSNKDLGKLITKGTVYIECHMTVAKIKKMIAQAENRKAFFKEHR